jgi:hypothetical protein
MTWRLRGRLGGCVAAVLIVQVAGCGRAAQPGTAAANRPQGQAAGVAAPIDPDMINAVSAANSTTPISVKFRIDGKPQVGQPLSVVLALIPADGVEIDHIHASFQAGEGMQLQSDRSFDVEQPTSGVPLEHALTLLPQRAGVFLLTATVEVDSDSGSIARTYSIPVISAPTSPPRT